MRHVTGTRSFVRARGTVAVLAACGLALAGCGEEDSDAGNPAAQTVNSPAQIAQVSADDYNDNENGLITAQTLMHWIDDWENNRPDAIDGRLVVLQLSRGPDYTEEEDDEDGEGDDGYAAGVEEGDAAPEAGGNLSYITPKPEEGVLSYTIDPGLLVQSRTNGVIETVSMVPDGPTMDEILKAYGLDPTRDMIVWAIGEGGNGMVMRQGRGWYMMRYWGTPKENLAKLNGMFHHEAVMDPSYLGGEVTCDALDDGLEAGCLPNNGRVSVRDLPEDNISLQATLEDMIEVAEGRSDAFVWDARSRNEYAAWDRGDDDDGNPQGVDFRNSAALQGHPDGAVVLPWTNILKPDGSARYKSKADIEAYMNGALVDDAQFEYHDSGSLIPLGEGNAYQPGQPVITYCETTFRAMITGFASAAILGVPNRFYDGAMREWNSLAGGIQDKYGSEILPADSPWRTDLAGRSHFVYNDPTVVDSRDIQDAYADRTNKVTSEDRAYRLGTGGNGGDGGNGGGIAPPANPCGG